jgi:purine-nucleoside phosphorylase
VSDQALYSLVSESRKFLINSGIKKVDTGIILGSGMNAISSKFNKILSIPYTDIPHLTNTAIKSHKGELVYAESDGKLLLIFAGRIHYYEGHDMWQVAYPVRILAAMGAKTLLTTGAAGGLNPDYKEGDIVLLTDHINLMPDNPLRGPNDKRLGLRFPDMSEPYTLAHVDAIQKIAKEQGVKIHAGVYASLPGPSLETRAEYSYLHTIGADLVAMSIVPEVIAAVHAGLDVVGLCIVSNICYPPDRITETTIDEVIAVVSSATNEAAILVKEWISYP